MADLREGTRDARPQGSKFFQFQAVFVKFWQNRMLGPPGELVPPPRGKPGSATGETTRICFRANQKTMSFTVLRQNGILAWPETGSNLPN